MNPTEERKNIFDLNLTNDRDSKVLDGESYVVRGLSPEMHERLYSSRVLLRKMETQVYLPKPLRWLRMIALFATFVAIGRIITDGIPFFAGFTEAPFWYYFGIASMVLWFGLSIYERKRGASLTDSEEFKTLEKESETMIEDLKADLRYPDEESLQEVDLLCMDYIFKDGKKKCVSKNNNIENRPYYLFQEGDKICFADMERVVGIPISEFGKIKRVTKQLPLSSWNKTTFPNAPQYKSEGVKGTGNFNFILWHYVFEIGDGFELKVPGYDLDAILDIIGIKIKGRDKTDEKPFRLADEELEDHLEETVEETADESVDETTEENN